MNPLVAAGSDHLRAVGGEEHGVNVALRLAEGVEPLAVGDPPELDGLIAARRGEHAPSWMPGEIEDGGVVDVDFAEERAVGNVPEPDRAVVACRRH